MKKKEEKEEEMEKKEEKEEGRINGETHSLIYFHVSGQRQGRPTTPYLKTYKFPKKEKFLST